MDQVPLAVLGADLDGLIAALSLAHQGFPVTVLERGPRVTAVPDLVFLTPSAVGELAVLGLEEPVAVRATEPAEIRQADGRTGEPLRVVRLGPSVRERYGHPYLTLRRSDLRALLVAACDADEMIDIEFECAISAVEDLGEAVLVTTADGRRLRAEALVGADGPSSRVRPLLGGGHPISAPFVMHSGPGPAIVGPPSVRFWASPHLVVAQVPVAGHTSQVAAVMPSEDLEEVRRRGEVGVPSSLLARHHPEVRAVAACAFTGGPGRVYRHHARLERWSRHRITVLGAAAVPTLPHSALSTPAAIVDAGALGAAFDRADGRILAALDGYVRSRTLAWSSLGQRAHDHAQLCHADGLLRRMRDRIWTGEPSDPLADVVELPASG